MAMGAEAWRERLDLADYVPAFAQRILHVGCGRGGLGRLLKSRGAEVHGVEPNPQRAARARAFLDSVTESAAPETPLPFGAGYFDAIVLNAAQFSSDQLAPVLTSFQPFLDENGILLILAPNPEHWRAAATTAPSYADLERAARDAGFGVYIRRATLDPLAQQIEADTNGTIRIEGREFHAPTDEHRLALFTSESVWVLVKRSYNPVAHAHTLFAEGHPAWCYEALSLIPKEYLSEPLTAARVSADMQLCVLEIQRSAPEEQTLALFGLAQAHFRNAAGAAPTLSEPYLHQAEFWRRIGDPEMGLRLLQSVQAVQPTQDVERALSALQHAPGAALAIMETAPQSLSGTIRRVLFITHERPNYGLDVLYDGLCEVLGAEAVIDYPWKPSLHGQQPRVHAQYPCLFDRPGEALALDALLEQLRSKRFDLIVFGDIEQHLSQDDARRIVDAADGTPVCIVDAQDEPQSYFQSAAEFLGDANIVAYFKREYLACRDYGALAYPLPFAYADCRIPHSISFNRSNDIFWAGQRGFGTRRLYLEALERRLERRFDVRYTPAEYAQALAESRICLSFFGFGFDTVRYWEAPAHGCMLFSERIPIRIPNNFVDGESAVFFDSTHDLLEKLEHYRARPEDTQRIAEAGLRTLREHHTGSARARQLLACVEARAGADFQ